MILHRATTYWTTGITLTWHPDGARNSHGDKIPGWSGHIDYLDDGWSGDDNADDGRVSTEGTLHTRYIVRDGNHRTAVAAIIDALIADATRLGIQLGTPTNPPMLFVPGDGEWEDKPVPDGWRELLTTEAARIGWNTYSTRPANHN